MEFANPQLILCGEETFPGKSTISEVPFSQKSYVNNTWECELVTYLNYKGASGHSRNSPAAVEQQTPYREMGKMLHTACCMPCTTAIPCDLHLMMMLQVLLITEENVWTWWLDTNLGPLLKGTAWFCTGEKARHKCEMLVEERVNCIERTRGSFKLVQVTNYIFRSDHFNSRYFRKDQQTARKEDQVLSSRIKDSC